MRLSNYSLSNIVENNFLQGVKGDAIPPIRGKMHDTYKGKKVTEHEHLLASTSRDDGVANVVGVDHAFHCCNVATN